MPIDLESLTHNERSPKQWEIIQRFDFSGTIVDLGCGYADLLFRIALEKKPDRLIGVDDNPSIVFRDMNVNLKHWLGIEFHNTDILEWIESWNEPIDTAICFSVLPYLDSPDYLLAWLSGNASQALIECQYKGDGPGFPNIEDDYDMGEWLGTFWDDFEPVGYTTVDYRGVDRTIWLCVR